MATQYLSRELKENEVATSLHKTYSTAHSGGLLGGIKEEGHISTFLCFVGGICFCTFFINLFKPTNLIVQAIRIVPCTL